MASIPRPPTAQSNPHTQVSIRKLKEIHTATHPAKLTPAASHGGEAETPPTRDVLLDALAAEADEEDAA